MIADLSRPLRFLVCACVALLPLLLGSCSSSSGTIRGLPKNLPVVNLHGSPDTPPSSLPHEEYPFDSGGTYMTAWAAEGEKKAGRGPASDSDIDSWRSSHGGAASRKNPSPVKKVSSSTKSKKVASSGSSKSKSTKGSKSSGGSGYTIQKGDSLSSIARKNGTTVAKLKAANGMSSDFLREGKPLKIPK